MPQPPVLPGQPCPAGDVLWHAVGAQNVRFGSSRSTTLPHILAVSSRDTPPEGGVPCSFCWCGLSEAEGPPPAVLLSALFAEAEVVTLDAH